MRKNVLIFYLLLCVPCSTYMMHGTFSSDDLYARDICGCTCLHIAAENGNTKQVQKLLNAEMDVDIIGCNQTPLHNAIVSSSEKVVEMLLAAKANVNAEHTILGNTPLYNAVWKGNAGIVKKLLYAKATLDAVNRFLRDTPLHIAASEGYEEIAEMLLDAKANVNTQDRFGFTSLHEAVMAGHLSMVKFLVKRGADTEAKVIYTGKTAEQLTGNEGIRKFLRYCKPLAFLMASHPRLGENSPAHVLPRELFREICG